MCWVPVAPAIAGPCPQPQHRRRRAVLRAVHDGHRARRDMPTRDVVEGSKDRPIPHGHGLDWLGTTMLATEEQVHSRDPHKRARARSLAYHRLLLAGLIGHTLICFRTDRLNIMDT